MPTEIRDSIKVGTKCVVLDSCQLRGDITLGSGTILQPQCTIIAAAGPIIFGSNNIVEENVVIANRHKEPLIIGDSNLFEVGCRVESPSVGSHNTFGIKSRVSPYVAVGSHCVVGAGCIVLPSPFSPSLSFPDLSTGSPPPFQTSDDAVASPSDTDMASPATSPPPPPAEEPPTISSTSTEQLETLPDYTHVFGRENRRRKATGEGTGQAKALFVKHWEYLRDTLPKYNKLKLFQ
ncbi:hypothetical protein JCM11641_006692 [Rhodosporidiobolus odoratus]